MDNLFDLITGHYIAVGLLLLSTGYLFHFKVFMPWIRNSKLLDPKWVELSTLGEHDVYIRKSDEGEEKFWVRIIGQEKQIQVLFDSVTDKLKFVGPECVAEPTELVSFVTTQS